MHLNGKFFEKLFFLNTVEAKVIILSKSKSNHMKTPYDRLAKIYTYCTGHMTKMATTPIYGKNPLNILFSGTKRPMSLGLDM